MRQSDECVIEGAVAVWVVLTHHLTHDRGALAVGGAAGEAHLTHRVEDAAVDWLEAVTHVWKGARHDHAHGVIEVARAHLVFNANRLDGGDADAVRANPVCAVIYALICHLVTSFLSTLLRVLNVEVLDLARLSLDEVAARLNALAHQHLKDFVRRGRVFNACL